MTDYSEKLKDPKWQKCRLLILERDNWECQWCGDEESTLHVHHLIYEQDKEPWEYEDELLVTLCENCHNEEGRRKINEDCLIEQLRIKAFSVEDVSNFSILIHSLSYETNRKSEMLMIEGFSNILSKHEIDMSHNRVKINKLQKQIEAGGE